MTRYCKEVRLKKNKAKHAKAKFKYRLCDTFAPLKRRSTKYLLNRRTRLYKKIEAILGKTTTALLFDGVDIKTLDAFLYENKARSSFIYHLKKRTEYLEML